MPGKLYVSFLADYDSRMKELDEFNFNNDSVVSTSSSISVCIYNTFCIFQQFYCI